MDAVIAELTGSKEDETVGEEKGAIPSLVPEETEAEALLRQGVPAPGALRWY